MAFSNTRQPGKRPQGRGMGRGSNNGNFDRVSGAGNGRSSPSPAASPKQSDAFAEDDKITKHMHDRMLFLLGNLIGSVVQVTVTDGSIFEGVFHGASTEDELGVTLSLARKIKDTSASSVGNGNTNASPVKSMLLIAAKDMVDINAKNIDLGVGADNKNSRDKFKTDTQISGQTSGQSEERELQRWNPEGGAEEMVGLEENNSESWDQFDANEKLFGLKTDFNEEDYTTRLDRTNPRFHEKEKEARKIASEIQKSVTNNPHVLEERNAVVKDSNIDEEDRYGAVVRDPKPSTYISPSLREKSLHGPSSEGKKAQVPLTEPKPIEIEVAETFRQFARSEENKIKNISRRVDAQKTTYQSRMEELKKFSQTFKLKGPVPDDIARLMKASSRPNTEAAPDTAAASVAAEESKKQETSSPAVTRATQPTAASASGPASLVKTATDTSAPVAKAPTSESKFKFNVNASEFKPNPTAPAFVPAAAKLPTESSLAFVEGRSPKKTITNEPLVIASTFVPSFSKGKVKCEGPRWEFGNGRYQDKMRKSEHYGYHMQPHPGYAPQFMPYQPYVHQMPFNASPPHGYRPPHSEAPPGAFVQNYHYQQQPRQYMPHAHHSAHRRGPSSAHSSTTDSPPIAQSPSSK